MLEKFKSFVKIACDFDPHGGPTVMLFGQNVQKYEHTNLAVIDSKLANIEFERATNTDMLLEEALEEHREERAESAKQGEIHPGTCLMIFTDGEPTNEKAVERKIVEIANSIDRADEFDIVFLTVGSTSPGVTAFLNRICALDTKYKIVSVKELDKVSFLAAAVD